MSDAPLLAPLPDTARLWIFGAREPVDGPARRRLLEEVDAFLERWKAHGHPLAARREWLHERFLLVGVDERVTPPSGCSIDALIRALRGLEGELGLSLVGNAPVWYRDTDGHVRTATRVRFREMAKAGEVTPDTPVFDFTPIRVGEVRRGWEAPAAERWHGPAFF